jgi:putative transposase
MAIKDELIDELLKDYRGPEDILGEHGILKELTRKILERALQAEMTHHLGYGKYAPEGRNTGNSRNGKTKKTLIGEAGELPIETPRDREGSFEPVIVRKGQKRFDGFDGKILSLYARGMTTREIQGHLEEVYGVEVSPELISHVTQEVMEEVRDWQNRPLETVYPILYLDALMVKTRAQGHIVTKAVYLAVGVDLHGLKEVLGLWIEETEGAKFWLQVLTELKNRGVQDIFLACVDGLTGLPEAIETLYPKVQVQLSVVHMIRQALKYVSFKDRKGLLDDLKRIYRAPTAEAAQAALEAFARTWDGRYPKISKSWQARWDRLTLFLAYPPEIRYAIYTTNAIESLNRSLRKIIKNRGAFPNDEAVVKLLYLALRNIQSKWTGPVKDWPSILQYFSIHFDDRLPFTQVG